MPTGANFKKRGKYSSGINGLQITSGLVLRCGLYAVNRQAPSKSDTSGSASGALYPDIIRSQVVEK